MHENFEPDPTNPDGPQIKYCTNCGVPMNWARTTCTECGQTGQ